MGKASIALLPIAITLLGTYLTALVATEDSPWFLTLLLALTAVAGASFLVTASVYLVQFCRKRRNPLDILDDHFRCTYNPRQRRLGITLFFADHSGAPDFITHCTAQIGQETIAVNDDTRLMRTYLDKNVIESGRAGSIIAEFFGYPVDLNEPRTATVRVTIKPSRGMWATKKKTKNVQVQIVP